MCVSVYVSKLVISVYEHVCAAMWTWGRVSMYECAGACVCKCVSVGAVCKCIFVNTCEYTCYKCVQVTMSVNMIECCVSV